ncbi:hypothetical protein M011DRAFT_400906, partial [Sporormia fimetaria CBS 119925]
CMMTEIAQSQCKPSDFQCILQDQHFIESMGACVKDECTIREALTTKNITETLLGNPVRDHTKMVSYTAMSIGMLTFICVILRVIARLHIFGGVWGKDDWVILAAMIPTIPITFLSIVLAEKGLGKDMWTVPHDNITDILRIYYFDELFYLSSIGLTKISILLFYLRIFPERTFRRWTHMTIALCILYMLGFGFAVIGQCTPVNLAWNHWDGEHDGHCINLNAEGWAASAVNMVLDLMVMFLPARELARLKMSRRKRLGILAMFLLGLFVTIISAIRLNFMIRFANTQNVTWDYTPVGYWSVLEIQLGIIVACFPALRALQHRLFPRTKKASEWYKSPASYRYGTGKSKTPAQTLLLSVTSRFRNRRSEHLPTHNGDLSMQRGTHTTHAGASDELAIVGHEHSNTQVERASTHDGDTNHTFLDTSSLESVFAPPVRFPSDGITVKKEYSVNVEYKKDRR